MCGTQQHKLCALSHIDHVGCSTLKSSELSLDRFDLLSLLLIHNTGLQDPKCFGDRAHSRVTLHALIQSQLDETFSQLWRCFSKKRLSLLEVASDLFVQKWLRLWVLSPLPQVADIDTRPAAQSIQDAPAARRTSACWICGGRSCSSRNGLPLRPSGICTKAWVISHL